MSKQNIEKTLRRELRVLNEMIDQRIIRGMSYAREAKRHKFILESLARMRKNESRVVWFPKFSLI